MKTSVCKNLALSLMVLGLILPVAAHAVSSSDDPNMQNTASTSEMSAAVTLPGVASGKHCPCEDKAQPNSSLSQGYEPAGSGNTPGSSGSGS